MASRSVEIGGFLNLSKLREFPFSLSLTYASSMHAGHVVFVDI